MKQENPNLKVLSGGVFNELDERIRQYRQRWKKNPEEHIVERFPVHLDLESTSVCNLKCTFCASRYETYSLGYMTMEHFARAIDEGAEKGLCSIKLNFRGEPLLHSNIHEMVAYAKKKGILDVFFNTNGTMLTREQGEKLIRAGLDRLIVSFEGFEKEAYEKVRVGSNFEVVVENVKDFVRTRKELGARNPALRLQTVAILDDEDYRKRYQKFWQGYADEITCIDMRDEAADHTVLSGEGWECPYLFLRLCVSWEGVIYLCPFSHQNDQDPKWNTLGHIQDTSLEEVWTGERMQEIRRIHREGLSHTIEPCRSCSYRGTELQKRKKVAGR